VSCESAPFMRTVRCRTVANALSMGFDVRKCACLHRSHFAHRLGLQVYSLFGNNFVKTILRLARECDQLGRVDKFDQAEPGWHTFF
jgi:hypothetical protein